MHRALRAAVAALVVCSPALASAQTSAAPVTTTPEPARPANTPASPPAELTEHLVHEDIQPSVPVVKTDKVEVRVGSLVQVHAALLAGKDSLVSNDDPATRPGVRIRRAQFGLQAALLNRLGVLVAANLLQDDPEVGTVADAKVTYDVGSYLRLAAGTEKVPFARAELQSSRTLLALERPLSVSQLAPSRRLGVSAEGALLHEHLGYLVGVMNGSEGFVHGNQYGGILYGARVEVTPWSAVVPGRPGPTGVSIGGSALSESNSSSRGYAWSADALLAYRGASLQLEALCDHRTPLDVAPVSPGFSDAVDRCGDYAEAGYALLVRELPLQAVVRAELFDDNRRVEDSGDALLWTFGVNAELLKDYARAQLQYVLRTERFGPQRDNNELVLALQGTF